MGFLITKYLITAGIIVTVSEVAKRNDKLGALLISLPLTSVLTLLWLYAEKQPDAKLANHAFYTFWYVLPTLPMFLVFPVALKNLGFILAISLSLAGTAILILLFAIVLKRFGIHLF